MKNADKHFLVALVERLQAVADYDGVDHTQKAVTVEQATNALQRRLTVAIPPERIRKVLVQAAREDRASEYVRIVRSPFAEDRFLINLGVPVKFYQYFHLVELMEVFRSLKWEWLSESINNILKDEYSEEEGATSADEAVSEPVVPASDRYVLRSDNEAPIEEIVQALPDLVHAVESSNSIEAAQREIALAEIAIFEATLVQPQISIELIERFLRFCQSSLVGWIGVAATQFIVDKLTALISEFAKSFVSG